MENLEKRRLIIEHAKLTAAHASGNDEVVERLKEIEDLLQMSVTEIATLAIDIYMSDY